MSQIWTIYKRELKAYLVSPIPYVFAAVSVILMGTFFFFLGDSQFFVIGKASLEIGFFDLLPWVLLFLVPAISMRLWSDEIHSGTLETLMTLPTTTSAVAIGKFLAAWTLLAIALACTLTIPITVSSIGDLDWGPVWGGYFGAMLLGGALLAIGIWISAWTRHQMAAFLFTGFLGAALIMISWLHESSLAQQLSLMTRYQSMGRGVVDLRDVVYFASIIGFFLYLNIQNVENRRVK